MKLLAFVLSVYILALNFVPCQDSVIPQNEVKIETPNNLGEEHHHEDAQSCAPFCQCQCCHINIIHITFLEQELASNLISTEVPQYQQRVQDQYVNVLLQPPQL